MVRKTKEEALVTRNLLLDTAEQLFSTQGVTSTTLHDIAEAAGLTRGAIYWHFENKSDLLKALWERIAGPLCDTFNLEETHPGINDPLGRIRLKTSYKAHITENNPRVRAFMTILMLRCEFTEETRSATEYFMQEREQAYTCVRQDIEQAIVCGQLPAGVNAEQATFGLFGLANGLTFDWLVDPLRFDLSATMKYAVDAYLAGLGAIPSRA